ncbi:MAG TPA: nitrophenyl compound nitroreductase subunit ArsF family protein [Methanoregulaceae archaeon]|nr:nitrophenyl compound nitroreductase subunit ArsF family protein [Methanoregulaceae archaeon]HQJ88524.1 nitrophenyl compound nitroreductase subunit ArsF family protein [Methanoregulaceae archaeon]
MIRIPYRALPPRIGTAVALTLIVLGTVLMAGCTGQNGPPVSVMTPAPAQGTVYTLPGNVTVTKLEVIHFHPTRQCASCITVGDFANATVTTYFADELASGRIVFRHINGELRENRELVERYGATGSSLWLGVYTSDGGFYPEENIRVWYRIDDRQRFMDYLKGVIEQRLAGDLTPA